MMLNLSQKIHVLHHFLRLLYIHHNISRLKIIFEFPMIYHNTINLKSFVVNHKNGDVSDYHPSNLNWLKRTDNSKQTHVYRTQEYMNQIDLEREKWIANSVFNYSMYNIIKI